MAIQTVSNEVYQSQKAKAIQTEIIRKELFLSEFQIDGNKIVIDGVSIPLSEHAFNRLMKRMRLPRVFAKRLIANFGEGALTELMKVLKTTKDWKVTLVVDPVKREIADVLPDGYASISNDAFFTFAEEYIDKYNLDVTHVGSHGFNSVINTVSGNGIFQIPGMENEVFQTGVSFRNDPKRGLEVSPFLTRLVCTNGMTSNVFEENFQLHSFNDKKLREFNDHMLHLATCGFQPTGFVEKMKQANQTPASIGEVTTAISSIMGTDKAVSYEFAQRYLPTERINRAYEQYGVNTADLTKAQLKHADSGLSVWETVNAMTNFASNQTKFKIDNAQMAKVMVKAGDILMKNEYDMGGFIAVNPFAKGGLLTTDQSNRIMGNN